MKRILFIIVCTVVATFTIILLVVAVPTIALPTSKPPTNKANAARLSEDVNFLTNLSPARNYRNEENLNLAALHILNVFQNHCDAAFYQKYQTDLIGTDSFEAQNVICQFNSGNLPKLIIGAHYDVAGDKPGADDNASGVAGLLELSRLLHQSNLEEIDYQIELVAYTLEEPPFFKTEMMGSSIHAKSLQENNQKVISMVSLEMIGYFSDEPNSQKLVTPLMKLWYPSKGNFIGIIGNTHNQFLVAKVKNAFKLANKNALPVYSMNAPKSLQGVDYSDHLNYWNAGYPAVMVTDISFYRNKNYHEDSDTADTLDYNKMALVVDGVYNYTLHAK